MGKRGRLFSHKSLALYCSFIYLSIWCVHFGVFSFDKWSWMLIQNVVDGPSFLKPQFWAIFLGADEGQRREIKTKTMKYSETITACFSVVRHHRYLVFSFAPLMEYYQGLITLNPGVYMLPLRIIHIVLTQRSQNALTSHIRITVQTWENRKLEN